MEDDMAKSMISVNHRGNFDKTNAFFKLASSRAYLRELDKFGELGVQALARATPKDSGKTASSWSYKISVSQKAISIVWINSVDAGTAPLAVLLQYGHGTRQGAYVQGRDYINPATRPVFDEIAREVWNTLMK
jgi:hypothetical protein